MEVTRVVARSPDRATGRFDKKVLPNSAKAAQVGGDPFGGQAPWYGQDADATTRVVPINQA